METLQSLKTRRTIRLYSQKPVPDPLLAALIDAARMSPVAMNSQTLRYVVARTPSLVSRILAQTAWAGLVRPRRTPVDGVSGPAAFIAVTAPKALADNPHTYANAGAAIHAIQLAAHDMGLGSCWLGSFQPDETARLIALGDDQAILYLVAVGYPAESPVSEDISLSQSQHYYLDERDTLHVPKLSADAITTWL